MNMTDIYYKRSGLKIHIIDGEHVLVRQKHRAADSIKLVANIKRQVDQIIKGLTSECVSGGRDGC
jgi:hypothetical protein